MSYTSAPRHQDSSFIGKPITYTTGPHAGKTIRAQLEECQKPDLGRKFAKRDRRPIDPPPVVRVRMWEVYDQGLHTQSERELPAPDVEISGLVAHVDLFRVDDNDDIVQATDEETAQLTMQIFGNTFVAAGQILDMTGQSVIIFVFADLSVRLEGRFALRYRFLNLVSQVEGSEGIPIAAELYGGPFTVYSTKEFPGLQPSTPLTKHLSRWCIRVNLREGERKRKSIGGDDDDDDEDTVQLPPSAEHGQGKQEDGDDDDSINPASTSNVDPGGRASGSGSGGRKPASKKGKAGAGGGGGGKGKGKAAAAAVNKPASKLGVVSPTTELTNATGGGGGGTPVASSSKHPQPQPQPPGYQESNQQGPSSVPPQAGFDAGQQQQPFIQPQPGTSVDWSRAPAVTGAGTGGGGGGWTRDLGGLAPPPPPPQPPVGVPNWNRKSTNEVYSNQPQDVQRVQEILPTPPGVGVGVGAAARKRSRVAGPANPSDQPPQQQHTAMHPPPPPPSYAQHQHQTFDHQDISMDPSSSSSSTRGAPTSATTMSFSPTFAVPPQQSPPTTYAGATGGGYYRTPPMQHQHQHQQRAQGYVGQPQQQQGYAIPAPPPGTTTTTTGQRMHTQHQYHTPNPNPSPGGSFGYGMR